ncbi:MAG: hypothetical protein ABSD50_07110 [Smithella sp.]|jgi:hypothetical protein
MDSGIIGVLGTVLGVLIGGPVTYYYAKILIQTTHNNAIDLMHRQEFNKAASDLRASFAPHLAYLKSIHGSIQIKEEIRGSLYDHFIKTHCAELEKFRFFVKSKSIDAYNKACEEYETVLHPGLMASWGTQEPSEFIIDKIETLLNFTK